MPIINFLWSVLWRISFIVIKVASAPPSQQYAKMVDSLTRWRVSCFDAHLSYTHTANEISDIAAKYATEIYGMYSSIP